MLPTFRCDLTQVLTEILDHRNNSKQYKFRECSEHNCGQNNPYNSVELPFQLLEYPVNILNEYHIPLNEVVDTIYLIHSFIIEKAAKCILNYK